MTQVPPGSTGTRPTREPADYVDREGHLYMAVDSVNEIPHEATASFRCTLTSHRIRDLCWVFGSDNCRDDVLGDHRWPKRAHRQRRQQILFVASAAWPTSETDPEPTIGLLDNGHTNELAGNPRSTIYVLVPSDCLGPASRAMKCHSLVAFVVSRLLCTQSGLKCRHGETSCEAPCLSARGITWWRMS